MNIFNKFIRSIDGIIDGMDKKTQGSIKNAFYFVIFCLTVTAIIIGGIKGRESAKIKSPPIIGSTDDVFSISKERGSEEGRFNEMLEGDIINELKAGNPDKTRFKSREGLNAESRLEPFEMERDKRRRAAVDIDVNDSPVEGEYVSRRVPESDVKPLGKKWGARSAAEDEPDEKKIDDDGDMKMPAPEKGVRDSGKGENTDSESLRRKKQLYRGKQKEPGVMYHDLKGADK